jgi:3'-phosphoadenosine 5'-phosphosulfate sulfotransferase (PAPS reductase)/FAD synthetase
LKNQPKFRQLKIRQIEKSTKLKIPVHGNVHDNDDNPSNHPDIIEEENYDDTNGEVAGEDILLIGNVDKVEVIDVEEEATVVLNDELNEEEFQTLNNFGIPKTIKHSPMLYGTTLDVWQFFHRLSTPYHNKRQK